MKNKKKCRHFRGDIPCPFHKEHNVACDCQFYEQPSKRVLLIKEGRAGDVVRTAPILHAITPGAHVDWLTGFPDIVNLIEPPNDITVEALSFFNHLAWERIKVTAYDEIVNLDKDHYSCALTTWMLNYSICRRAKVSGFMLNSENQVVPADWRSNDKWIMGIDDAFMRKQTESYIEQTFKQLGFEWEGQRAKWKFKRDTKKYDVALCPFAGPAWKARRWPALNWRDLATRLSEAGLRVFVLSGPDYVEQKQAEAIAPGVLRVPNYAAWFTALDAADTVVCLPSLPMNVANQLGKRVVLFNNVFNRYEFANELAAGSAILQPPVDCVACYKSECKKPCLDLIDVEQVARRVL